MDLLPVNKICCPTDFSEPSYEALKTANELAMHFSAELSVVHVVSPIPIIPLHDDPSSFNLPLYEKEMEHNAVNALSQIRRDKISNQIDCRTHVLQGNPAGRIVSFAKTEQMDIIVIATHGFTGWRKFMFGSVTERVIRMATCPVLSIRLHVADNADKVDEEKI